MRKEKDFTVTLESNFSYMTLTRIVSDGHFLTKRLREMHLENEVALESSDRASFVYLITFLVIFWCLCDILASIIA